MSKEKFTTAIEEGYTFKNDSIILGGTMLDGEACTNSLVKIPLKTMNRHGLIAGATSLKQIGKRMKPEKDGE